MNRPLVIWLTGLSGSGKSTLALHLAHDPEFATSHVSILDGDVLRKGLCKDLGFSDTDRSENIRRTAEVAKLLNGAGVTVICALISPSRADRELARRVIGTEQFIEVHVAASLQVCEARDVKGLYKKARQGDIPLFTGISSLYEEPESPEIRLSTSTQTIAESMDQLVQYIRTLNR
jgi:adenylyl-sulfate kinase